MADNQTIADRLNAFRESKGIRKARFERICGLSNGYLNSIRTPSAEKLEAILKAFPELNRNWVMFGEGEMTKIIEPQSKDSDQNVGLLLTGESELLISNHTVQKPPAVYEAHKKTFPSHVEVRLVPVTARAGFTDAFYSEAYLDDLPTVLVESDMEHHGNYLAFEIDGDSMEPDYHPGDVVICREVKRELWRYKLHIDDWDFVIAHGTRGIMLKQIIFHDVETGDITCHSINQDGHPDFILNLREIAFLYNVVEHRIQGKNKRRYR